MTDYRHAIRALIDVKRRLAAGTHHSGQPQQGSARTRNAVAHGADADDGRASSSLVIVGF